LNIGTGPATLFVGKLASGREEDAAVPGEHIGRLQSSAVDASAFGNPENLGVEAFLEYEAAFLGRVVEAGRQRQVTASEVALDVLVERGVESDCLADEFL
jgi:hypothetical protein